MNRRQFNTLLGMSALVLGLDRRSIYAQSSSPQFSITMDDFYWNNQVKLSATERNRSILDTLSNHSTKAALFVIGGNIEGAEGKKLLAEWDKAGHLIGNHTYSHRSLNDPKMTVEAYQEDILRSEELLKTFPRFRKYFRFPMLKEGDTAAKRDGVRSFLERQGYRNGHVTIDTSDWAIDPRMIERLKTDAGSDLKPYRDYYLEHVWDRAQYYDSLARRVVGRPVKHTILTHFNLLNALFLGDLIVMLKSRGWQLIDAEEAFTDPVFREKPNVLPAGESIIWSLAKADGTIAKSLRYPAEDGQIEIQKMKKLGL